MDAELIAIGPYSKDIISYLPYHPDNYSDVTEGTKVIAIIHHCDTTTESRDLAETFGFEAWDFNSHFFKINESNVHDFLTRYKEFLEEHGNGRNHECEAILELSKKRFEFIYLPNQRAHARVAERARRTARC